MPWFGGGGDDDFVGDEFEDSMPPFWETDVVTLSDADRRSPNYYEGLEPLWPRLGQLMVRDDDARTTTTRLTETRASLRTPPPRTTTTRLTETRR
jgi:hypothetical protein